MYYLRALVCFAVILYAFPACAEGPLRPKPKKPKPPPAVEVHLDVLDAFAPPLPDDPLTGLGLPDVSNYQEPPYQPRRYEEAHEQQDDYVPEPAFIPEPAAGYAPDEREENENKVQDYRPPQMFGGSQEKAQVNVSAPSLAAVPPPEVYTQILDGTPSLPTASSQQAKTQAQVMAGLPVTRKPAKKAPLKPPSKSAQNTPIKDITAQDLVQPTAKDILESLGED